MLPRISLGVCSALLSVATLSAQFTVPADQATTIESGGPNGVDFYAQFSGGQFDEYSIAEFTLSDANFAGQNVTDINSLSLRLTVNDRNFSSSGPFTILFTADSAADLTSTSDYDLLSFDPGQSYGINTASYTNAPVVVGTGTYDETIVAGGETLDVTIDLTNIETALLDTITSGGSVHFLIGVESSSGTTATFSGVDNSFDPGDPTLVFDVTTDGPSPEPSSYPTAFAATPDLRNVELAWTDSADATGYLVMVSDTNSFTPPTDGIASVDDLDLSDGSGAIDVAQGLESAVFIGLTESTTYYFSIFPYSNVGAETDYKTDGTPPSDSTSTGSVPVGDILITQYYEGSASNKYIELSNVSGSEINLNDFILTSWSNATTEDWKSSGNTTTRTTVFTGITIAPGASIIVADPSAASPISSGDADVSNGQATFFNGNDSVVLYASSTQDPTNIVDAIPFTDNGNEGSNTSFVRTSTDPGFDLTAGSSVLDFPSVWLQVDTATVDAASFGADEFLGSSDLVTPPPQVFFTEASFLVSETGTSVDLTVEIQNPDGNAVDVDVAFSDSESTATLADVAGYTTQTITFGAGAVSGDQQTVTITLTDDSEEEVTENAVFILSNLVSSGTTVIAAPSSAIVSIQDDDTPIPNVFISEVVDPADNDGEGRYVELYNPTGSDIDLGAGNWNLVMYFNENATGTDIPLTGTIPAGGTYIIAESANFDSVYSVADEDVTGNINFNGNDNLELRFSGDQATGVLVDVYGTPGVDGNLEAWNFADSRAVRLQSVTEGNSTWNSSEWAIIPANVADASPRIHPEVIVLAPTDVSATAVSDTEIELAFTTVEGNDVVIVFNTSGEFTEPSGTPPAAGQPFAGGTVLYQGQSSPQSHTGLAAETQYFYALYSVSGTDYSNAITVNATTEATPLTGILNEEDFNDAPGDADDWFNATVTGNDPWDLSAQDAFIDGLTTEEGEPVEGEELVEEHYLVSPAFNFSSETNLTLTFDYAGGFDVAALDSLEFVYSTNYSGSGDPEAGGTTWTPIAFDFTNVFSDSVTVADLATSGPVALPTAVEGETTVYLAFRYYSDGTINTEQWLLDNLVLQTGSASDPLGDYLSDRSLVAADLDTDTNGNGFTVIEEYLAGFGDGLGADTIEFGITTDPALALTLSSDLETDPDGIVIELLATSDLAVAFAPVAYTVSSESNGDGSFTRSYTETNPPVGDQRFLQLRLTAE